MRRALWVVEEVIMEARDVLKKYGIKASFTYSFTKFEAKNPVFTPVTYLLNRQVMKYMDMFKEMDYTSVNFYVVGRYEDFTLRFILRPRSLAEIKAPTPLAVTEFGIATRDGELRYRYLCAMASVLKEVNAAVAIWWSFLHGYEWGLGYQPFFALVDVVGTRRVPKIAAQKPPHLIQRRRNANLQQ
jgi:beta-glucosidase